MKYKFTIHTTIENVVEIEAESSEEALMVYDDEITLNDIDFNKGEVLESMRVGGRLVDDS
jgi:hypothetical protein